MIPQPPTDKLPEFTDEQVELLVHYMIAVAKSRAGAQGADFNEVDFLMGCTTTLFAIGKQNKIPAGWIFGPMGGRSALGLPTLDREVYVVHLESSREPVALYEHRGPAEEHLHYLTEHGDDSAVMYRLPVRHALHPKIMMALDAVEEDE